MSGPEISWYISLVHLIMDLKSLHLIQSLYFFQKMSKKVQVLDQVLADPVVVIFFWNALDPTFVIFLKMTGSSLFISPNGQGWKINSGLWAVVWAGLWEKRGWVDYEQLLRPVFFNFWGSRFFFSKFFLKHHSVLTEKLHKIKVKKNVFWGREVWNRLLLAILWFKPKYNFKHWSKIHLYFFLTYYQN